MTPLYMTRDFTNYNELDINKRIITYVGHTRKNIYFAKIRYIESKRFRDNKLNTTLKSVYILCSHF